MSDRETIETGVTHCARCGQDHERIMFVRFIHPVVDEDGTVWGYWGTCPVTSDPILLRADAVKKDAP
jgi:hypothetical protein